MQGTQPETQGQPIPSRSLTPPERLGDAASAPRLGRFTLLERVGVGGMGVVFSAYDPDLDRKIAIKLVRTSGWWEQGSARGRTRALAEARAMARVSHPNVVTVYEVGAVDDDPYVAMEFVRGSTVRGWAAPQRTWREIAKMFAQIARGLSAVHAAGLVHRDIKPENLMVRDDGRAQVLDFGIARTRTDVDVEIGALIPTGVGSETDERGIVGTPAYLAPEIFAGCPADGRSDQWALCVAMYEVLYGQQPFVGNSLVELASAIADAKPPVPPKDRDVPRRLHAIVARGLSSRPDEPGPRSLRSRVPSTTQTALDAAEVGGCWPARRASAPSWLRVCSLRSCLVATTAAPRSMPCGSPSGPIGRERRSRPQSRALVPRLGTIQRC